MHELSSGYDKKGREAALARLAGRQHGAVGLKQLYELSFSDSWVRRALAAGRLTWLHRGVYALGIPNGSIEGRAAAAKLAGGPRAAVSHLSAAVLHGIVRDRPWMPIHLTLPTQRRDRRGLRFHQSRTLTSEQTGVKDGIRITTVFRTLVDLADTLTTDELERALGEAHRLGLAERSTVPAHSPGRRGLTAVIKRGHRMTRSQIERRFLADLRNATTIPPALVNEPLLGYEADFYWPDHGLVVEIDDYSTHGDRLAFERDRRKQNAYTLAGLRMLRITEATLPGAVDAVCKLTVRGDPHGGAAV